MRLNEKWLPVTGYKGYYEVSNLGQVRSIDRLVKCRNNATRCVRGRVLAQNKQHYYTVNLSKEGQIKVTYVHALVLRTFVGVRPRGKECLHGPRGNYVNCLTNLRYGTHSENEIQKQTDGTSRARSVQRSDGKQFLSLTQAAIETNTLVSKICEVCRGTRQTAGGFSWEYTNV